MAETEIIAIATTIGTSVGAVFTWLVGRRKVNTDDQATFRKDLIERLEKVEDDLKEERSSCDAKLDKLRAEVVAEQHRCDEKMEALRADLSSKLQRQTASIRAEYRRDLEEASNG